MNASFCHMCGNPLTGMIHLLRHPRWPEGQQLCICTRCYRSRARCQVCGMPLADHAAQDLCPTCQVGVPHCLTCNNFIKGRAVVVDGIGPFCEFCFKTRIPCDICGAPLTDHHWLLSDGRVSCSRCHSMAVDTQLHAGAIYEEVKQVIDNLFGLKLNIPTHLTLVDRNRLSEILLKEADSEEHLDPNRTLGVYVRKGIKRGIFVLSGLPANVLVRIAAHEHAHAWQGENCPLLRDPLLREGFAEWIAYHVLAYYRLERQQEIMRQHQEDIYGQGLQLALSIENQNGPAGVIDHCRNSGRSFAQTAIQAPHL